MFAQRFIFRLGYKPLPALV